MLDIKLIREQTEQIQQGLQNKGCELSLQPVLDLDQQRRALVTEVETLKNERNVKSKEVGQIKKTGGDADPIMARVREIGEKIKELDQQIAVIESSLQEQLLVLPNVPGPTTPIGPDESANQVVRTEGSPVSFDFEPKPHWEIGDALGIFEFERAARLAGSGFPMFRGAGARLERVLIQFMLDMHTQEHGYEEISPPFLCNPAAMTGTGQLPKMKEDMYFIGLDELYLIPTAEVPVTNIYREEIIQQELPIRFTAYTPCFRREAGAAGKDNRGLNRVHQFDKVEMVAFVKPETSYNELEKLLGHAEDVLKRLGLHYRILELCSGDLSFAAAKCYDIELWAPGQNAWLEVSSCSNFEDFQARRAGIRYRDENGKPEYVHTLNGSGVALARLVVALIENGQQADGSVLIPEALRPYMGGMEKIAKS